MAKSITVGEGVRHNPYREIDLGPLRYQVDKFKKEDVLHVVYRLSYAGKYIFIKGKSLAGSLIILTDTLSVYDPENIRFKGHLYSHLYSHVLKNPGGRFRIEVLCTAQEDAGFYGMLKTEQMLLDEHRYSPECLNNQTEAYVPLYNEKTGMYGWIPKTAVMLFNRYLKSAKRKALLKQYKK